MNRDDKELIATELEVQAEDIRRWPDKVPDPIRYMMVKELFDIMRQIMDS